ncbi:MAG TPA: glycosyltransferase family 2 protein [Pseudolysinimonas sp.]|jgi:GT2 family glycosyltransferase|nr:glycosyltransferase family 2 protein [Pseudolysinimonas sp.]
MQPRVTAIVVVRNGETGLERTLAAVARQTRRPDTFVFVDAGSTDASAAILESARAVPVISSSARTFGGGIARAVDSLGPESPADWLWLLEAGTVPEPAALHRLLAAVEVAPSVAVAGPKLVDPVDPTLLLSYGESISRNGETVHLVDAELDQAQYDSDGDVLGVSAQGMLVRRALWSELGGFDPGLPSTDAGLDFSIRTRLAGARVVRVPDARVARASRPEDFGRRRPAPDGLMHRLARSAQLHRRLVYASGGALIWHWLGLVPLAVLRSIGHLVGKRPGLIGAELASGFAAAFDGSVGRARARLRKTRRIPWAAIAPLRVPADEVRERRAAARERRGGRAEEPELVRASFLGGGGAWLVLFAALVGVAVFWSLLQAQVVIGGALLPIGGDLGRLWAELVPGPREGAVGVSGPADPFTAVVAVLGSLTAWSPSFSLVLLWLTALPLAALGAWWCATRLSERRWPPLVAALLWMLAPPLLSALTDGRPTGVLVHLALPFLVLAGIEARRSWSAAATASILFAVVVACSPVLTPVLVVLLVAWAAANPRGIVRILGVVIPAAVLAAPLIFRQLRDGRPVALLADPGPAVPAPAPSGWLLLLGHPSQPDDRWVGIGQAVGLPLGTLAPAVLLAPIAVLALVAVFLPGARRAIPALAVALGGLATAVLAVHLPLAAAGSEQVTPWAGAALSLYWAGLAGAAVVGVDAIHPAGVLSGLIAVVAAAVAVAPMIAAPLLGTAAVSGADSARLLPALVQAEADADPGIGTLVLTAQPDGSLRAVLARDAGTTLDETSTLVSTRSSVSDADAQLAELAGNLASRSGYDPEPMLQQLHVAFVVVPELSEPATGPQSAVRQRTTEALDANPVLTPTGSTPLWQYERLKPGGSAEPAPSALAIAVPVVQGVVFLIALLLAIPTSRRRRAVRESGPLESDPADTFAEDDDG